MTGGHIKVLEKRVTVNSVMWTLIVHVRYQII